MQEIKIFDIIKENTKYTLGINGEIQNGSPDILYQSIIYIKDTKQQWTHG